MANKPQFRRLKTTEDRKVASRERSASDRGYGWYWSSVIAPAVRERDVWLCQECLREGGLAMAMEEMLSRQQTKSGGTREPIVDHIIPAHRIPAARFNDMDNLQTLCDRHHVAKSVDDAKKYGVAPR